MNIKTKLSLGVGFLFLLIMLLIGIGVRYINKLSGDTQNILVANYNTIDYSRQMLIALDGNMSDPETIDRFKTNLLLQQKNITESGERELTNSLTTDFDHLLQNIADAELYKPVRKDLTDIMLLNMQAIQRKSAVAESTAVSATRVIAVNGTICFLLAFILLMNLPGNIANPIKEFTRITREIAAKNYSQRVHFESRGEFGDLARSFNTMAEKLEEYNNSNLATLMMEKKRIDTLINNMRDPVIGMDENNRIIFINNEALNVAGLNLENTIGKDAQEISLHNDLIRSLMQKMKPAERDGKSVSAPIKIFADGKESYFTEQIVRIEITPTAENNSRYIGDVILLQNITPFKELDTAKTNFIATVSHELKTPVSSIMMSTQLLEGGSAGKITSAQHQLLESIRDDSSRLLKIIGELLNMTQVETGKIQLNVQHAQPLQFIQFAVEANRISAESENIILEVNCPENIPMVMADIDKTTWVLTNLISNAIHYSTTNSRIIISARQAENNSGMVEISVRDFGRGIDSKYRDKIFDRYFQVPGSSKSGSGLGLAISKEFIEAESGSITVSSEVGLGSTFTILLNTEKHAG